jgi:hypothetical protein
MSLAIILLLAIDSLFAGGNRTLESVLPLDRCHSGDIEKGGDPLKKLVSVAHE